MRKHAIKAAANLVAPCLALIFLCAGLVKAQTKAPVSGASTEKVAELEKKVQSLSELVNFLLRHSISETPSLDCASHRFNEIRLTGSSLVLFISCEDVQPYLEGHRVKLRIGNPYSFDLEGLKGNLWYGATSLEAFQKGSKVEVVSTQKLRSGSWLSLEVVINPSKPSQLRELSADLAIDTVVPSRP